MKYSIWLLLVVSIFCCNSQSSETEDDNILDISLDNYFKNEYLVDDTLYQYFKVPYQEAMTILTEIKNRDLKKFIKRHKSSFSNPNYSKEQFKQELDFGFDLLNKYGIPKRDSVEIHCSYPIFMIETVTEFSLSFRFPFPNNEIRPIDNRIFKDEIVISFNFNYDQDKDILVYSLENIRYSKASLNQKLYEKLNKLEWVKPRETFN